MVDKGDGLTSLENLLKLFLIEKLKIDLKNYFISPGKQDS